MLARYNPILKTIRDLCPTAHIGGGAVRDTLLERPVKDVDLFLEVEATEEAAKLLRSQYGFVKVGEWETYEGGFSDPAVARVAKFEKADETIPVCLIGLKRPYESYDEPRPSGMQENLARFDFGICMAGWDGEQVYVAPEYKRDVESKTFTLCRADDMPQFIYSMSRFHKMTADRYAGWELVVPAKFGELLRDYSFKKTYYFDEMAGELKFTEYGKQQLTPKAR